MFPLSTAHYSGTLLENLTVSLANPPPLLPEIFSRVFIHLNRLVQSTKMHPGTLHEAGRLAGVLRPGGMVALSIAEKKTYKIFCETIVQLHTTRQFGAHHLEGSLAHIYPAMPDFACLVEDVTALIVYGQLAPPPFNALNALFFRHYRKDMAQSTLGSVYFRSMHSMCQAHEQVSKGPTNDEGHYCSEITAHCGQLLNTAQGHYRRFKESQSPASQFAKICDAHSRAKMLHQLRCAIVEEVFIVSEIEKLVKQCRSFWGIVNSCFDPHQEFICALNAQVDNWYQHQRVLVNQYTPKCPRLINTHVKLQRDFSAIEKQFPFKVPSAFFESIDTIRACSRGREVHLGEILRELESIEASGKQDNLSFELSKGLKNEKDYYTLKLCETLIYHFFAKICCLTYAVSQHQNSVDETASSYLVSPTYQAISEFTEQFVRYEQSGRTYWQKMSRFPVLALEFFCKCHRLFREYEKTQCTEFMLATEYFTEILHSNKLPKSRVKRLNQCRVALQCNNLELPEISTSTGLEKWRAFNNRNGNRNGNHNEGHNRDEN